MIPASSPESTNVVRKARFTPTEAEANNEIVRLVGRLTKSKASESAITRILWTLLRDAEAGLRLQGRKGISLKRPPNGSSIEMVTYEHELGMFILDALTSGER